MKRFIAVAGISVLALAACAGDSQDEATAVCVDPASGVRVDDSKCGSGENALPGWAWFYILSSLNQPSIGAQVTHNNYYSSTTSNRYAGTKAPASVTVYRNVPKTGWKPSAGTSGFTSKSKTNVTVPQVKPGLNQRQAPPKPIYNPPPPRVRTR